jgi:pimeloyl-ACP methyl ester carboxylesterase
VIALDAPGYGESAELEAGPADIRDFSEALAETLDALNLTRVDLYGFDTSAPVAAEFARRFPERVRRLVLDRPPLLTDAERDELLESYCPPIVPDAEGSHVTKAWGRLRDMYTFRPWYRRNMENRLRRDLPAPLEMYYEIADQFRAGLNYAQGPHAAWRYNLAFALPELAMPVTIVETAAGREQLEARATGSLPPRHFFAELRDPDAGDVRQQVAALIRDALAGDPLPGAPAPPKVSPVPGKIRRTYVDSRAGQLLVRMAGSGREDGGGLPLILSNGTLWSGAGSEQGTLDWAVDRPVYGFDLPGVGDSPALPGEPTMTEIAGAVIDGIDSLGLDEIDLYGSHTSAIIAMEISIARPKQVKHLILDGVTMYTEEQLAGRQGRYLLPLNVTADGAFLTWAWHFIRDMNMWYPWYDHRASHFRSDGFVKDPAGHHERFIDFLRGGLTFANPYGALMRYPTRERLPLITVPTLLCASPDDTLRPGLEEAATFMQRAITMETPGKATPERKAETSALFRRFFADEPVNEAPRA